MRIKTADASNIDALAALEAVCFPKDPWSAGMFSDCLNNPACTLRCAFGADGELAGYIVFWRVLDEIHIGNLAVAPDARRRGVAHGLLKNLFGECPSAPVTLEVRAGNAPAIALYTSEGFKTEGIRPKYYYGTEDGYIMWRRVAPAGKAGQDECGHP